MGLIKGCCKFTTSYFLVENPPTQTRNYSYTNHYQQVENEIRKS